MIRCVIFDVDGVLVASGPAHAAAWRLTARKHGVELTDEQFEQTFGLSSRDIIHTLWGPDLSDQKVAEIDDEKERTYRGLVRGMMPLTIGVRETLARLSAAGLTLALATSGPPENVEMLFNETGIGDAFAAVVHGFDVEHGKPAPDCFLLAAERCNASAANCAVIEDAPAGIEAAVAAGMLPIGLAGTHPAERLTQAGAKHVLAALVELTPELLTRLSAEAP